MKTRIDEINIEELPQEKQPIEARFLTVGGVTPTVTGTFVLIVGIKIRNKAYWPVLKGDLVAGMVIPENGVLIRLYNKPNNTERPTYRYIKNSFYDERIDLN